MSCAKAHQKFTVKQIDTSINPFGFSAEEYTRPLLPSDSEAMLTGLFGKFVNTDRSRSGGRLFSSAVSSRPCFACVFSALL